MRITSILLLSSLFWPSAGSAQVSSGPAASMLFSAAPRGPLGILRTEVPGDTLRPNIRPTYWTEGALIGGALGALGGAFLGHGLCGMSEEVGKNCSGALVLGGVLGAALLAVPGALIGGQFPKKAEGEAGPRE